MKKIQVYTLVSTFIAIFLMLGCKSQLSLAEQEKLINAVEYRNYVITPSMALPMNWKSINLTPSYYLKVYPDSLSVYLPYYGRSYQAPMDSKDIGYDFSSTNFEYSVQQTKDMWEIIIEPRDYKRGVKLYVSIGNTGYADIRIQDNDRQGISYSGTVEALNVLNN